MHHDRDDVSRTEADDGAAPRPRDRSGWALAVIVVLTVVAFAAFALWGLAATASPAGGCGGG